MYDYDNIIEFKTTKKGEKIITMNKATFTRLLNALWDGKDYLISKGYNATANDVERLWKTLYTKDIDSEFNG